MSSKDLALNASDFTRDMKHNKILCTRPNSYHAMECNEYTCIFSALSSKFPVSASS